MRYLTAYLVSQRRTISSDISKRPNSLFANVIIFGTVRDKVRQMLRIPTKNRLHYSNFRCFSVILIFCVSICLMAIGRSQVFVIIIIHMHLIHKVNIVVRKKTHFLLRFFCYFGVLRTWEAWQSMGLPHGWRHTWSGLLFLRRCWSTPRRLRTGVDHQVSRTLLRLLIILL